MFMLTKRLKALKQSIRELSKTKLGNLPKKTKEAYQELCEKQKRTLENPNQETIREESRAYERWQHLAELVEEFLKQRSKLHWLEVGDGNNHVFHSSAKIREVRNAIHEIQREDGSIAKTEEEIKGEAEGFFAEFMRRQPLEFEGTSVDALSELLGFKCDEEDCTRLVKDVTREEIKEVLFKMPSNKSSGPDGFTTEFFKEAWDIIGGDVVIGIQSIFLK